MDLTKDSRGDHFMTRKWQLMASIALAVVSIVAGTPATTQACICYPPTANTSVFQGKGATCTKATNKVYNQAYEQASLICSSFSSTVCGEQLTITSPCTWDPALGAYVVQGQLYFNCLSCGSFCSGNGDCPIGWTCVNGQCE
jgi:hypothetical protein